MVNARSLKNLAIKIDKILKDELGKNDINYDMAEVRVWDAKSVGVIGDERAYSFVAKITLYIKNDFVWDERFIRNLSTRITNEVETVGRIVYLTTHR